MNFLFPAVVPVGVDVNMNMMQASYQWDLHPDQAAFMLWFYYQVRNRGPWDFKQYGAAYENFGNFHYGAVGTVGQLPEQLLLRAAGFTQRAAGTQNPDAEWGYWFLRPPYGDDPKDQLWIARGIRYAQTQGY